MSLWGADRAAAAETPIHKAFLVLDLEEIQVSDELDECVHAESAVLVTRQPTAPPPRRGAAAPAAMPATRSAQNRCSPQKTVSIPVQHPSGA